MISGGDFTVSNATKVYVLDNATIDLEQGRTLLVNGTLHVLATAAAHAHFTSHKLGGGALANGEGFSVHYDNSDPYDAPTKSGNLLQNTLIDGLQGGQNTFFITTNSYPRITNCRTSANALGGTGYLTIFAATQPLIDHNAFDKIVLSIIGNVRASSSADVYPAFRFEYNVVTNSYYAIQVANVPSAPVESGQIRFNSFAGNKSAYLYGVPDGSIVPLGSNFWPGGTGIPPVPFVNSSTTATVDFATPLSAASAGVGPSW